MNVPLCLLWRHVIESNLIEGISTKIGPLYTSHVAIAHAIARRPHTRPVMHPDAIHRALCYGTEMASFAGCVRTCEVIVGKYATPKAEMVPYLLKKWWQEVIDIDAEIHECTENERALLAEYFQHYLLLIHPFEDGNGRTARLFWNMLRLRWGLPWQIVYDRDKWRYYAEIAFRGERWFRKEYPASIYPEHYGGKVRDPGLWWLRMPLSEQLEPLPTGRVPMRASIRPR